MVPRVATQKKNFRHRTVPTGWSTSPSTTSPFFRWPIPRLCPPSATCHFWLMTQARWTVRWNNFLTSQRRKMCSKIRKSIILVTFWWQLPFSGTSSCTIPRLWVFCSIRATMVSLRLTARISPATGHTWELVLRKEFAWLSVSFLSKNSWLFWKKSHLLTDQTQSAAMVISTAKVSLIPLFIYLH